MITDANVLARECEKLPAQLGAVFGRLFDCLRGLALTIVVVGLAPNLVPALDDQ